MLYHVQVMPQFLLAAPGDLVVLPLARNGLLHDEKLEWVEFGAEAVAKKVCAAWFCACGGCQLEVPAKSDCAIWYTGTAAGTNGCVVGTYCCCWSVDGLYMV